MKTLLMFLLIAFNLSAQGLRSPGFLEQTLKYRIASEAPGETLLLDEIGTSATFALSAPRKLRSAYSGNSVTVYRDSDGTSSNIGFDGNLIDTNSLASFCGAGSCYVTNIFDQSGNGNNLSNALTNGSPLIYTNGVVIVDSGGRPTMFFDPDDVLSSGTVNYGLPITRLYVVAFPDFTANARIVQGGGTARQRMRLTTTSGASSTLKLDNGGTIVNTTASLDDDVFYLVSDTWIGSSGTEKVRVNDGSEEDVGDAGDNTAVGLQMFDSASLFDGWMSELVVYASDLSSEDEQSLRNNVNAFYSLW